MHIKSLHLKEFKGFTDLTLTGIPPQARLVMLIGPNGTGKSSIFDALLGWTGAHGAGGLNWDDYYRKKSSKEQYDWNKSIESVELHEELPTDQKGWRKLCYFRTAYRNEPDFVQGRLGGIPQIDQRNFNRTIENDAAVSANYQRLVMKTIKDVWGADSDNRDVSLKDYANAVLNKVNDSLARVIPHLRMESLGDPSALSGNFYFTKGVSKGYLYKSLSGGSQRPIFTMTASSVSMSRSPM
jgi:predicted ATP-dependent endonuclease of OLD family